MSSGENFTRLTDDVVPAHPEYLKSYFRKGPMNGLFPVTIAASAPAVAPLAARGLAAGQFGGGAAAGFMLLFAPMTLAIWSVFSWLSPLATRHCGCTLPADTTKPTDKAPS